jgi:hypothetical protein
MKNPSTSLILLAAFAFMLIWTSCKESSTKQNAPTRQNEDNGLRKLGNETLPNLPSEAPTETYEEERVQTNDERIADIKKWYAEIQKIGKKNCKIKSKMVQDGLTDENLYSFNNKVSRCQLNDEYQLIKGELVGYEWDQTVNIYLKNGAIFFVFIEGGSEGYVYEHRYYCDKDENVIKYLMKEGESGVLGGHKTMKLNLKSPNIRSYIKSEIKELQAISRGVI